MDDEKQTPVDDWKMQQEQRRLGEEFLSVAIEFIDKGADPSTLRRALDGLLPRLVKERRKAIDSCPHCSVP